MFYFFLVEEEYCDYFWFLWYKDNKMENLFVIYRMRVYVFGNCFLFFIVMYGF